MSSAQARRAAGSWQLGASASAPPAPSAGTAEASRAEEDRLVERAKTDADAFGTLYDRYVTRIYRYVYSRVHDRETAEDLTSEVFCKALGAIGRYRPSGRPYSAWLFRIAINAVNDHYRAWHPTQDLDTAIKVADPQRPVADQVAESAEAARAWAAIDDLSPHQRAALTLKLGEDMMLAQIGEIMGKSEGAVKLLVHRGMIGVRQRLATPTRTEMPA